MRILEAVPFFTPARGGSVTAPLTARRTNLLITSNNPVAADAMGSAIMAIPLGKAKHILVADGEGLGATQLDRVMLNDRWRTHAMQFMIRRTIIDRASVLLFNSELLARTVIDSPSHSGNSWTCCCTQELKRKRGGARLKVLLH
jgi:hypothetical protein